MALQIGVDSELVIIEGAPHTFDLQPKQRDLRPLVIAFFDKYLRGRDVTVSTATIADRR